MNKIQYELSKLQRPEYIEDTKRIVKIAFEHGIILSLKEAEDLWLEYSDNMAAGWMSMDSDSDDFIWSTISAGADLTNNRI